MDWSSVDWGDPLICILAMALDQIGPQYLKEVWHSRESDPTLFANLGGSMLAWAAARLGPGWEQVLAKGYAAFVADVNRSQARYERVGHYTNKTFEEVNAAVYGNQAHMDLYHWGVYVTTFVWAHHLRLHRHFLASFVRELKSGDGPVRLLDLGAGSGVWHLTCLNSGLDAEVTAIDISSTSVAEGQRTADCTGWADRVHWQEGDALTFQGEAQFGCVISCFLLEHLERPELLFANIANNLKPGGLAYVTCALTAAEVDHIYEFRRESQPLVMAENAGLRLISSETVAPARFSVGRRFLPRSMGMLFVKRTGEFR